jgi:predicted ester cyclase
MSEQQSETERNKAVVQRFIEEVQNQKDWAVFDELNAPDFVNLSAPPGIPADLEGGKMFLAAFVNAFPDSHVTIDDMIAEGDRSPPRRHLRALTQASSMGSHRPASVSRSNSWTSCVSETASSSSTG